ncbi:MAG: PDZ domain-containing protein [Planctomycetes bacterium]|nr:PDZ domain-containing protein [Planctomycetota bacterium]
MSLPRRLEPAGLQQETRGAGHALFVLGLAAGLLAALAVDRATRFFLDRDIELVRSVRDLALADFVREVPAQKLIDDALAGMLAGLDDHSRYFGPPEIADLDRETSGEFLGIGVVFREGELGRILFPYPGSPAEKAGLRVGDRIVGAEGQPVEALDARALRALLHREDAEIRLDVESLEGDRREVRLRPGVVLDPTVPHVRMLEPERGIGYACIRSFSHRTMDEFDQAVASLQQRGLRALVLDLRFNPGGILDAAISIANRFVAAGALVATRTRTETRVTEADPKRATLAGLPLVVLLDQDSASASEVLAAALQDHAVAVLVGEPSYGKGTVQTLKRIGRARAVVKLTTANYCSPSLRRIEHEDGDAEHNGIAPDLWVPLTRAERGELLAFLRGYSPPESALQALRAWEQRGGLDLIDEPPMDRQLVAALALLAGGNLKAHGLPLR